VYISSPGNGSIRYSDRKAQPNYHRLAETLYRPLQTTTGRYGPKPTRKRVHKILRTRKAVYMTPKPIQRRMLFSPRPLPSDNRIDQPREILVLAGRIGCSFLKQAEKNSHSTPHCHCTIIPFPIPGQTEPADSSQPQREHL
jgi:hypothetical protein